jgi:hypothetical protein
MWRIPLKVTAAVAFLALMMVAFGGTHSAQAGPPQPSTDDWDVVFDANPATAGVPVYGDTDTLIENGESQKVEVHMSIDTLNLSGLAMSYQAYFDVASNVYSGFLPVGAFGLRNQDGIPSTDPPGDPIPGTCAAIGWSTPVCQAPQTIIVPGTAVGSITYFVMTNIQGGTIDPADGQPFMCGDDNGDGAIDGAYVGPITATHYGGTTFATWSGGASFPPESLGGKCPDDGHVPDPAIKHCFAGTQYVQGFDDDDDDGLAGSIDADDGGDTFSQAQSSARGNAGILDGAEFMISWIPDFIRAVGLDPIFISRSYGVAKTVPGVSHSDVSFMFFDTAPLGAEAQGIVEFTIVGGSPFGIPEAETSITCPPFTATTIFQGLAGNGGEDGKAWGTCWDGIDNGPDGVKDRKDPDCAPMSIIASTPGAINSDKIILSRNEDADADGVAVPFDLCRTMPSVNVTAGWAAWDADRDGIGNECDTVALGTQGPTTKDANDFDSDGWLNTIDNCPTAYNPDQIDSDSDSIGNVCDPARFVMGLGQGWAGGFNDSDDICEDEWTEGDSEVLFTPAPSDVDEYPPMYTGKGLPGLAEDRYCVNWLMPGAIMDSNDNMTPDYTSLQTPAVGDKDSDSDYDGCSDMDESIKLQGGAKTCGADPLNHDANGNGVMDGLEDSNTNGKIDLKDQVGAPVYSADPSAALDMDGDECSLLEELTRSKPGDPFSPWDFYDVTRDGGIGVATDVVALLKYSGALDTGSDPRYNVDLNGNTVEDGLEYDRSAMTTAQGNWPGPPDGGIGVATDVVTMLNQAGMTCQGGASSDSIEIYKVTANKLLIVGWGWGQLAGDVKVTCTLMTGTTPQVCVSTAPVWDGQAAGSTGLITRSCTATGTDPITWALCKAEQPATGPPFVSTAWKVLRW